MEWLGEKGESRAVVCSSRDGYTIFVAELDGALRISGPGWRKRKRPPRLRDQEQAVRIAERIARMEAGEGEG